MSNGSADRSFSGLSTAVAAADGANLAVWCAGAPDAPTVLLIHGFSLDHTTWGPLADELVDRGFRVIAPDLRGHGESLPGTASPTLDCLVSDIESVLSHLTVSSVHLVGHSLGAVIALTARTSDMAHLIETITVVAATEQSLQNPVMKVGARIFSSRAGIWALGQERLGRLLISSWFGKQPSTENLDWIRHLSAACPTETRAAIAAATAQLDLRPSFALDGAPAMVVCGRQDQATPPKFSERIAAAIDGSQLVLIEDAGHMAIVEQAPTLAEHLTQWISAHSS